MYFHKQGLYDPNLEHDSCGVGFVVNINGNKDHEIIEQGIRILCNLEHRGAVGGDMKTGDGAGMLMQIPDQFFRSVLDFDLPEYGKYGAGFLFLPQEEEHVRLLAILRKSNHSSTATCGAAAVNPYQ